MDQQIGGVHLEPSTIETRCRNHWYCPSMSASVAPTLSLIALPSHLLWSPDHWESAWRNVCSQLSVGRRRTTVFIAPLPANAEKIAFDDRGKRTMSLREREEMVRGADLSSHSFDFIRPPLPIGCRSNSPCYDSDTSST